MALRWTQKRSTSLPLFCHPRHDSLLGENVALKSLLIFFFMFKEGKNDTEGNSVSNGHRNKYQLAVAE